MSKGLRNWIVIYSTGTMIQKSAEDFEELFYGLEKTEEVITVIRQEL